MLLGDRGTRPRCLLVWASGTAVLATFGHVVLPAALLPWTTPASLDRLPLDRAMAGVAATVLLGCAVWAWLALSAAVLEAARGVGVDRPRRWHLPRGVRRVVLAACGVALVSAPPALADAGDHPHPPRGIALLRGLPLPDRATEPASRAAPAARPTRARRVVEVAPGDSLWSIAADDLPAGASAAQVTARWHAIYAVNRALIGPDPDLLQRGQRLLLPHPVLGPLPGKDSS